jgi:nitrile hydratase subunit beta
VDGIHDLGGMEGFGPVDVEQDEPVFHADWERRAFGLTISTFARGLSNGGQFRHAIERMDPAHYLTSRYYEHWITGLATRLVETGAASPDELEQRAGGRFPLSRPVVAPAAVAVAEANRAEPRFTTGARVRVRTLSPRGHTRCPGYVRGRVGTVVRIDPAASVPDVEAHSADGRAHVEPIYSVRFESAELWGEAGDPVHVDLWESYLDDA